MSLERKPKVTPPKPVDREIILDKDDVLISITDKRGVIEYCNEAFVESSGYEEFELVGAGHNIVRHPDMPRVIFKMMWDRIQSKKNIIAVVKNLAKTGRYYWVITDFVVKEDSKGNITGYKGIRKPASRKAIDEMIPFYKKLVEIEKETGLEASEKFFKGFFDSKDTDYNSYIEDLVLDSDMVGADGTREKKKGSFFKWVFGLE
ncbi:PAS domain S-box-containing protein [Tenacibaculum sp. MAR_2009_124]|uniref:PAS domain-containing protein n=1 Tax=Tenacibaculum sp. MAR_2009_124 TaxID=1250059 RepID=UPI0008962B5C|nr:PAS domain-containing protein [Tenacibaculum sp. MAR_2009_124]SEB43494.1 PAS domain S-box-containing protein [Tenacibaculum sp. MAR_2009_124]